MPSSARFGDLLYVKIESMFNALAEINQSLDLLTFGTQYTMRAGSFVNINHPTKTFLTIRANNTAVAGYAYFSFMYVAQVQQNSTPVY